MMKRRRALSRGKSQGEAARRLALCAKLAVTIKKGGGTFVSHSRPAVSASCVISHEILLDREGVILQGSGGYDSRGLFYDTGILLGGDLDHRCPVEHEETLVLALANTLSV